MSELDDLPESVRDAWRQIVITCACDAPETEPHLNAVEAGLLRLTTRVKELERESAELRTALNHTNDNTLRAKQAESELAAIKARIAEAPVARSTGRGELAWIPDALVGHRVALLDMGKEG